MAFTATVRQIVTWTDDVTGTQREFPMDYTKSSIDRPREDGRTSDNSGFDVIYEATNTSQPEGDAGPGDAPFLLAINLTSASGCRLKFTDDESSPVSFTYDIAAGESEIFSSNEFGSTVTSALAKIEIQSLTSTACEFRYLMFVDMT